MLLNDLRLRSDYHSHRRRCQTSHVGNCISPHPDTTQSRPITIPHAATPTTRSCTDGNGRQTCQLTSDRVPSKPSDAAKPTFLALTRAADTKKAFFIPRSLFCQRSSHAMFAYLQTCLRPLSVR